LVSFMGAYWILPMGPIALTGITHLPVPADRHDSLSSWLASAWALVGGAVLVSDALLMRRRLLAQQDDPPAVAPRQRAEMTRRCGGDRR